LPKPTGRAPRAEGRAQPAAVIAPAAAAQNRAAAARRNAAGPRTASTGPHLIITGWTARNPSLAPSGQKLIIYWVEHRAPTAKPHKIRAGAPAYRVKSRDFWPKIRAKSTAAPPPRTEG